MIIVSGDKDLMQMISPNVRMWDTLKDQVIDMQAVEERFGTHPCRLIDIMGLAGDSSDNVPGVPGIGEKTAVKLIRAYESLEKVLDPSTPVAPAKLKEKLLQYKDQALLSRKLVTLDTRVPLDFSLEDLRIQPRDVSPLKGSLSGIGL